MMRNKNVKTEGNSTLLKMQYGHHRMIRSATQRRESEDLEGRRLKSAMLVKHPESNLSDAGDAKLTRKESLSNFYTSNPHLSKATRTSSFNSDKKRSLGENSDKKRLLSESYLYQKSHDSHKSIEDIVGNTFDPEEDFDYDAEGKPTHVFEHVLEKIVLTFNATSKGSGEPAQSRRLARASIVRMDSAWTQVKNRTNH